MPFPSADLRASARAGTRTIRGAVLETIGAARPYATSRPIVVSDVDLDAPGPGELLVRIEAAGICHSDLSVLNGSRVRPVPMLLGHESAGRVVEVGLEVDPGLVGRRVVMAFLPRCGECAGCRTEGVLPCVPGSAANNAGALLGDVHRLHRGGRPVLHHLGVSGFATHAVVNRHSVVPVDDDVPPEVAAVLGCAVLTGGGAVVNAGRPTADDVVAIVGLGGVGMAALLTAKSLGVRRVIGVDSLPEKLHTATALGVDAVYTPQDAAAAGVRAQVVVEAAGHPKAFETAVELTAPGGRTVTVGLPAPGDRASISPLILTAEARTIIGSYLGSAVPSRDIPTYVQRWREGRLPVERLISDRIRLEDVNEAMDALANGTALRQIIVFD